MDNDDIGSDVLRGVQEIARFRGENPRRTLYLLERGEIPHGREGSRYVASKRKLREHHDRLTGGGGAA